MRRWLLCAALASSCSTVGGSSPDAAQESVADAAPLTCDDTVSDPLNCGGCGRTCVIPNATAGCSESDCVIAACADGYFDGDEDVANGCESEGQACAQATELCNAADDNCNGSCDEGAIVGCRQGVHRAHGNGHLYTTDLAAAQAHGLEAESYFRTYVEPAPGLVEAFLCLKGDGRHFVTVSGTCENAGSVVRSLGYWATAPICGAVPLYRLYSGGEGNHFYTTNEVERDNAANNLGYTIEGIAGYVFTSP